MLKKTKAYSFFLITGLKFLWDAVILRKKKPAGYDLEDFDYSKDIPYTDEEVIIKKIVERHPQFSIDIFRQNVEEVFWKLMRAISTKDWEDLKPLLSKRLFDKYYIMINKSNRMINSTIKISELRLTSYSDLAEDERIVVEITYSIANVSILKKCTMTFVREEKITSKLKEELTHLSCPNCGAPLPVAYHNECSYCHTQITNSTVLWALDNYVFN